MRVVSAEELRRLVPMKDAIAAVREAYAAYAESAFAPIPRIAAPSQTLFVMIAEREPQEDGRCGQAVKIVTYREENPEHGRAMVQGVVLWFDGGTGRPQVSIDGAAVTALRTGAASGVATDLLAAPDAGSLAVLGTGAIAPDQVRAVCAVRQIRRIAIAGRDAAKARALARTLAPEFPQATIEGVESVVEAIRGADVICTATTARSPLFSLNDILPNVHINAVGSFSPAMREFGSDVVGAARLVCVDELAALSDAGELAEAIAANRIARERVPLIGELLRKSTVAKGGGITLFKSIGIAAQDWAIAQRVAAVDGAVIA